MTSSPAGGEVEADAEIEADVQTGDVQTGDVQKKDARTGADVRRRTAARASHVQLLVASASYLLAALVLCRAVLDDLRTSTIGLAAGDEGIFAWWLTYTPFALLHGNSPLVTDYLNYPTGVNGMWNTSVPLLGIIGAPITYTAGPVATFNILMILGPVVTGIVTFLVARRYLRAPAAWLTGLLYAFSPFALAHLIAAHLNLVWNILPPLLIYFVDEAFVRQRRKPVALGLWLGAALVVQAGIYTQTIALGAAVSAVVVLIMALRWRHEVRARWRYALTVLGVAGAVLLVVCAYPFYVLLKGPHRPIGAFRDESFFVGDLANVIVPTPWNYSPFGWLGGLGDRAGEMRIHPGEQGFYVGIVGLLVCVAALAVARSAFAWLVAAGALTAAVFALGSQVVVFDQPHGPRALPFRVIGELPVLHNIESVRFTVFVGLGAAVLIGVLADWALRANRRTWQVAAGAAALVAALTWAPAVNRFPTVTDVTAPAFFTDGSAAREIPEGSIVRTVPRATLELPTRAQPMLWQAWTLMHYKSRGGYFIGSEDGFNVNEARTDAFDAATDSICAGAPAPAPGTAEFDAARTALAAGPVDALLFIPTGQAYDDALLAFIASVTGQPGERISGVWVFDGP